ncbi:MAG: hypothetical protein AAFX50_08825, partial [Acidobacteriota bacterium]
DDDTAYLYVTEDAGATWTSLGDGLPAEPLNVVREDPVNADVLYVGSDRGAYASVDRGATWHGLPGGLPNVPVHDLKVHPRERELIAGTHGRSVWILDALPIQELAAVRDGALHVFPLENVDYQRSWRSRRSLWFADLEDPPEIQIPFWSAGEGTAVTTVHDGDERELRRFEMDVEAGVNSAVWDLLLDPELAAAAEKAKLDGDGEADGDAKKKKKKKKQKKKDAEPEAAEGEALKVPADQLGSRGKSPWAEAIRLGWPLYVTPGDYIVKVSRGDADATTSLTVDTPEPLTPRRAEEPKIRGQKDE